MSEISVPPPTPAAATAVALQQAALKAVTLPATQSAPPLPQTIQDAAIGAKFDLQLINLTQQGVATLDGAAGKLQVQLQALLNLNPGDKITLQLTAKGPQLQFTIAAINGQPPSTALRPATPGPLATAPLAQALPFEPGNNLTATLLRPAPGLFNPLQSGTGQPGVLSPGGPAIGAGTPAATPNAGASPAPLLGGSPSSIGPSTPAGVPQPTGSIAPSTPGVPTPTALPTGTQFTVQVVSVQPPPPGGAAAVTQTPGATPTVIAQGQSLIGVVNSAQTGGQTIVDTPLGPIAIATKTPPPAGTRVVLNIVSPPQLPEAPAPLVNGPELTLRQALFVDREWPAMKEAITTLEQSAPNMAQHMLQTALPRADGNLTTNVLFFLAAVRGGDLRSWLGDGPTRALSRANPGVVQKIREDLGQLSRLADDPTTGDWRVMMLPFMNGPQLEQIRILTRRQSEEEAEEGGAPGTRFVVDITLTKFGHIQLDGMVDPAQRRMDMVVRSENRLSPDVQNDIRHLYERSGDITGYRGGVGFQAQPANFIEVAPPAPTKGGLGLFV